MLHGIKTEPAHPLWPCLDLLHHRQRPISAGADPQLSAFGRRRRGTCGKRPSCACRSSHGRWSGRGSGSSRRLAPNRM